MSDLSFRQFLNPNDTTSPCEGLTRFDNCQDERYIVNMTTMSASDVAARRIREARTKRGWTVKELAAECARAGTPQITAPVITNLETRRRPGREITAEELLALAWVLDVPPVQLLSPLNEGEMLEVVPGETLGPLDTLAWMADDYSTAHLILMDARDRESGVPVRKRSALAVIRHLASAAWRVRLEGRTLADEELLAQSRNPAAYHEESVRSAAARIRPQLAWLEAAGHGVTLPADVAEIIVRYNDLEDELEEPNDLRL